MHLNNKELFDYWKEQRRQWHWSRRVEFKGKVFGVTTPQELERENHVTNLIIAQAMRWQRHYAKREKRREAQVQR